MLMSMKRGVGYCTNVGSSGREGCEDYAKGSFLLNHGDTFYCPRCREAGEVVTERGVSQPRSGAPFKEVRVEFNYDPINSRYREIGIVRDEAIWGTGSKYTLLSPLIKTEKRALKVAEAILANLQRYSDLCDTDDIPRTTETIVSFDDDIDVFAAKLKRLGDEWENSSLAQKAAQQPPAHAED
jgi:hypothetical protein